MNSFEVDVEVLASVAAATLDPDAVLVRANAGFRRLLPTEIGDPVGMRVGRYFVQPRFATLVATVCTAADGEYRGLITIGDPAGRTRSLLARVSKCAAGFRVLAEYDVVELERINDAMLEMSQQSLIGEHALARANAALRQREGRVLETALTDALTGVGNRRKLDAALPVELERTAQAGVPLSLIMVDIDHFKRVNDEHGHATGDEVLIRFGALLRAETRSTDTVARFGGEEFVLLLPRAELAQALAKAERLRVTLAATLIGPLSAPVTASFGVAEAAHVESAESLLKRVDAALYAAKHGGRNRVVTAEPVAPSGGNTPDQPRRAFS
jgi:diguanylate cyclase (GGDEF)-like protein